MLNFVSGLVDMNLSPVNVLVSLVLFVALIYYVHEKVLKENTHKKVFLSMMALLLIILLVVYQTVHVSAFEGEVYDKGEWQEPYFESRDGAGKDFSEALANTAYYDFENERVASVADKIADDSRSEGEAISKVLRYVYQNVEYKVEPNIACFEGTAPGILEKGSGQCDTQSIVVISMLRRMGIPAMPVGGCAMFDSEACLFQSLFLQSFEDAGLAPKIEEVKIEPERDDFSRGVGGGLHAWVVAWTVDEGWVHLEATTGRRVDTNCYNYHIELIPRNDQKSDICVSKNFEYAMACGNKDLSVLNEHGLGLIEEVEING